ncbi:MAG: hypothetical protein FJW29_10290 [Acidobacteria bacterium]|nr:hypothetical protein [Acidobacteriota bacterium]
MRRRNSMTVAVMAVVVMAGGAAGIAQEKPVPKDSMRITIPGCAKGVAFTVMESPEHESRSSVPPGRRFRLSGKKALLNDLKRAEGQMIEVTGLIRRGQMDQSGVSLGGGVSIGPGPSAMGGMAGRDANYTQVVLDVEGWRPLPADCPTR